MAPAYVLNRHPDAIIFSTNVKPSAPAERALFCFDGFLRGYKPAQLEGSGLWLYIRVAYYPAGVPTNGAWVNSMVKGFNHFRTPDSARHYWQEAIDRGMSKDFELGWMLAKQSGAVR